MARLARVVIPGPPHHVTQRGKHREAEFFGDTDCAIYLELITAAARASVTAIWRRCVRRSMRQFHVPTSAAALGILVAATFAQPLIAGPRQRSAPRVEYRVVTCDVTPDQNTANCGFETSRHWKPDARDQAALKDLELRPEHLAGATPGARVEVAVRRFAWPQTNGASPPPPADSAPPPPAGVPLLIADPKVSAGPSPSSLGGLYPERADRLGINGEASATCSVGPGGDLVGCWLSSEKPVDQGFGSALLRITTLLQLDPLTLSGQSSLGRMIKLGARFDVHGDKPRVQLVVHTN